MKKIISRKEVEKQIEEFFYHIKEKNPREVKKIKRLAMSYSIKLGDKKKTFCKKCLCPYVKPEIRIKKGFKSIVCRNCGHHSKWRIKK